MTTHKDRPHRKSCQYAQDECMACTCGGTREYQFGASVDDAIAIQVVATFFARMQPAVAYHATLHGKDRGVVIAHGGLRFSTDMKYQPLYASPVTPAAQDELWAAVHAKINEESRWCCCGDCPPKASQDKEAAQTVAVPDGWEKTSGGAFTKGPYSVVKRIDGKGWNGGALINDEFIGVALAVPLNTAITECERHAILSAPATPAKVEDDVALDALRGVRKFLSDFLKDEEYDHPAAGWIDAIDAMLSAAQAQKKEFQ